MGLLLVPSGQLAASLRAAPAPLSRLRTVSDRAPYSRIYWGIMDDPKFDGIREDVRHLGSWTLILLVADMAHPAPTFVPPAVPRKSLTALIEAGLVDAMSGGRIKLHGLESERNRRRDAAMRQPKRDPVGTQVGPSWDPVAAQDETRRDEDEPRRAEPTRANHDGRADLEAYLLLRRRAPTPKQKRLLDEVMDRHDLTGPQWAADLMLKHPDDPIGAVIEADKAWRAERIAAAQKAEAPQPKPRRPRGLPQTTRDIMAEMALLREQTA